MLISIIVHPGGQVDTQRPYWIHPLVWMFISSWSQSWMNFHPARFSHSFHPYFSLFGSAPCHLLPVNLTLFWYIIRGITPEVTPIISLKLLSLFLHYHMATPTSMVQTYRIIAGPQMLVSRPFVTAQVPWIDTPSLKMLFKLCLPSETSEPCSVSTIPLIVDSASLSCLHLSFLPLPTPRAVSSLGGCQFSFSDLQSQDYRVAGPQYFEPKNIKKKFGK